ncbi:hypothetical protein J7L01_03415, partial [bacterium]|nr:hypothetical protein [bacterium]
MELYSEGLTTAYVNSVRDMVDNQSTYIGGDFMAWHFLVDRLPPVAIDPLPASGGVSGSASPIVSIALADSTSGVNGGSIVFNIAGTDYPIGVPGVAWDGSRASFNTASAGLSWEDRDTVEVCIRADDKVRADRCGPNRMNPPFCWSFTIDQGGPNAEIVDPPNGSWTACEMQDITILLNDPSGVDASTIELSVDGTTFHGLDHSTYNGDTLLFSPTSPFSDGDSVSVLLSHALDSTGTDIDSAIGSEFFVDLRGPTIISISPAAGSIIGPTGSDLEFGIVDVGSGFAPESSAVSVDGTNYFWPSGLSWDGSLLTFDLSTAGPFSDSDTLDICLDIADRVDAAHCGPNERDSCFSLIFDGWGPIAQLDYPPDSAITACESGEIRIVVFDNYGVDFTTLQLRIAGVLYGFSDSEISISGDTIVFTPPTAFAHMESVDVVLVDVADLAGNALTGAPLEWGFIVDSEPPNMIAPSPSDGEVIGEASPTVSIIVRDDISGVNEGYFEVSIDGTNYSWPDPAMSWDGVRLYFDLAAAGLAFADGDTIEFCLNRAADMVPAGLCGPNIALFDSCFSFTFDLSGPVADLLVPLDRAFSACPYQEIVFGIYDDRGVVAESCAVEIDGALHEWPDMLSWNGDSLTFTPSAPFADGDTIALSVIAASDSTGNPLSGSYDWWFVSDMSAPVLNGIDPPPMSFVSEASPTIDIFAIDSLSGENPLSLSISIDGTHYAGMLPWIGWVRGHFSIDTDMGGLAWSDGDTIRVCIDSLADSVPAEYCGPNVANFDSCWSYFVDQSGPEVELIYPDSGAITACADSAIAIRIYDSGGVNEDSISLILNSVEHTIGEAEMSYSGNILRYSPAAGFSHGDTVEFTIARAVDLAGNAYSGGPEWFFVVDVEPPELLSIAPLPSAVLADSMPVFELRLDDDIAGVDGGSIELSVDGTTYRTADSGMNWDGASGILTFDSRTAGVIFSGDSAELCIRASDRVAAELCGPNSTEDSCFYYAFDLNAPEARAIDPSPGEFSACEFGKITIRLTDDSGIDDSSIVLTVDGVDWTLADPELSYIDDSLLIFEPTSPWSDGTIDVALSASDILGNAIGGFAYSFYIDLSPPELSGFAPSPGSVSTDAPTISFDAADTMAGIDAASLELTVDDDTFHVGDAEVSWDGATFAVAGIAFDDGDEVHCCASAADSPDTCGPNIAGPECW